MEKNLAVHRTRQENLRLHRELTKTLEELRSKNKQLEDAVTQLQAIAATDPLTGLANRRAIDLALEQLYTQCYRYNRDLACIMIDIDGFKQYNDALGHQCGDQLLIQLARVLEANCRRADVAGRFGGDEFIVLLPETDSSTARLVAKRIAEQFELGWDAVRHKGGPPVRCSLSMGLACLRLAGASAAEQLLMQADQALYYAKSTGKGRLCVFNPAPPGTFGCAFARGD
ncbi:MAG: diguanylate cyclase [Rhodospirillales bacterium]|nr:diguanylate cyclase [Rhodospirillales bacterium]